MNERIQELAEQCRIEEYNQHGDLIEFGFNEEKFAELIVRECMKQGDVLVKHYIDTHTEQEQALLLASIVDYTNEIKKHFGVIE